MWTQQRDIGALPLVATDDMGQSAVRVVVVDDHEVLRAGTRHVLETTADIVVVGEADSLESALAVTEETHPDLVLVDIDLRGRSGIDVVKQIVGREAAPRVVILSAYSDGGLVNRALEAGASGYLLKTVPPLELINSIRAIGRGSVVLDPAVTPSLSDRRRQRREAELSRLTSREQQVITLVANGMSNKSIGAQLGVSTRTVEGHLNHIFVKLGVESRTELVRLALTSESAGANELSWLQITGPGGG